MEKTKRPLILAADDSRRDRDILASILQREGFEVVLVEQGSQALEFAATGKPDLILLDILMPGLDGMEVCRILKRDPATREIPVIFLTGRSKSAEILAGFEAGAVDYVTKPFRIAELLARVHVHVDLRRARDEIQTLHGLL